MAFVAQTIKALMKKTDPATGKPLTRKQAKEIFNRFRPEGVSVHRSREGLSRQVSRATDRKLGSYVATRA